MRENPNDAVFFFADGDFLNLEEVAMVQWFEDGIPSCADDDDGTETPTLEIYMRGVQGPWRRMTDTAADDRARLLAALRVYHSKA